MISGTRPPKLLWENAVIKQLLLPLSMESVNMYAMSQKSSHFYYHEVVVLFPAYSADPLWILQWKKLWILVDVCLSYHKIEVAYFFSEPQCITVDPGGWKAE